MPKLTNEQLKEVRYVSLADFSRRIDQIEGIEDKVAFATRYLLTHGMGETDCSFLEAVHVARMKVAEASLKSKEKLYNEDTLDIDPADYPIDDHPEIVNAFAEDQKDDLENEMFMGNPLGYLKGKAKDLADEIEAKDVELTQEHALKENCLRLGQQLNNLQMKDVIEVDKKSHTLDMELRLQAKFGDRDIVKQCKPGFLSRAFGTYSTAYANLDAAYNAFNNPNHVLYGDMNSLAKAAKEYLQHRFTGRRPDDPLPTPEQIARLSGTKKARTELSVAILQEVAEQKKVFGHFEQLVSTCSQKNIQYESLKKESNEFQHNFQQRLNQDVLDDESELDDSFENAQVLDKSKEKLDDSIESDDMSLSESES